MPLSIHENGKLGHYQNEYKYGGTLLAVAIE